VLFYFQIFAYGRLIVLDNLMFERLMVRIHWNISLVYASIELHNIY